MRWVGAYLALTGPVVEEENGLNFVIDDDAIGTGIRVLFRMMSKPAVGVVAASDVAVDGDGDCDAAADVDA